MKLNEIGYQLIMEFEGFKSSPYLCTSNVPTIGFGNTFYPNLVFLAPENNTEAASPTDAPAINAIPPEAARQPGGDTSTPSTTGIDGTTDGTTPPDPTSTPQPTSPPATPPPAVDWDKGSITSAKYTPGGYTIELGWGSSQTVYTGTTIANLIVRHIAPIYVSHDGSIQEGAAIREYSQYFDDDANTTFKFNWGTEAYRGYIPGMENYGIKLYKWAEDSRDWDRIYSNSTEAFYQFEDSEFYTGMFNRGVPRLTSRNQGIVKLVARTATTNKFIVWAESSSITSSNPMWVGTGDFTGVNGECKKFDLSSLDLTSTEMGVYGKYYNNMIIRVAEQNTNRELGVCDFSDPSIIANIPDSARAFD